MVFQACDDTFADKEVGFAHRKPNDNFLETWQGCICGGGKVESTGVMALGVVFQGLMNLATGKCEPRSVRGVNERDNMYDKLRSKITKKIL